jgi:transcriptional regulator with PAS, ATPase and Fis domain
MYRIAVIYSSYPEMLEVAELFNKNKNYDIKVEIVVLDKAVEAAKLYEAQNYDLIISRGITGALIRKAVNIPVINIEVTTIDLINTLYKAKKYSRNIFVVLYGDNLKRYDFDFIKELLNLKDEELSVFYYKTEEELKEIIALINNKYMDGVIVAIGAYTIDIAKSYNMKALMVYSSKEAIYKAFGEAKRTIDATKRYIQINLMTDSFFKESTKGIILLDTEEKIIFITNNICEILNINKSMFIDRNLDYLAHNVELFYELSFRRRNYIAEYNGCEFNINRISLMNSDETLGYCISVEYLNKNTVKPLPRKRVAAKSNGLNAKYTFENIVGQSDSMIKLLERAKSYSKSEANILIIGESGTGKELLASSIHNYSKRIDGPYVAINCAALPQSLLESELFGYEEGAFTGAKKGGKIGMFELAENGTVFLDEISEITLSAQAQLLRVLQEKTIMRIGDNKMIPVNARIIAATNADLQQRVKEGMFREDLYHRLNVLNLNIPPLRERKDDISSLIYHFLKQYSYEEHIEMPNIFIQKLKNYKWYGNIRELQNFVEKFVILSNDFPDKFKLLEELYFDLTNNENQEQNSSDMLYIEVASLKDMENQIIRKLYNESFENKVNLAKKLGISRTSLWNKLKELKLD